MMPAESYAAMSGLLAGRIALVTGASRGIGEATALALAKAGAHVVAVARTTIGLAEFDAAIRAGGGTATLMPLDMKNRDSIFGLAGEIDRRFGRLDIMVANAGILGTGAPADQIDPAVWDDIIAVNLTANLHLIRAMHPLLKKSDAGRAVFVTSGISWRGLPNLAAYAASKAALNALVQAYASENEATPLRANLFSPGATRTDLYAAAFPNADSSALATPEDIAEKLVQACLPSLAETGKVYEFRQKKWLNLKPPA
ncbi:MAG: oxidoreductase [Rhizobium sp.]|nr:oxidoreductase [Rhizobium sp.]